MYKIIVSGISRYAEFSVDADKNKICKEICEVLDYDEDFGCDIVILKVLDDGSGMNAEEKWNYLSGTKEQIVELLTEYITLSFSEYKVIFSFLGAIESGDEKLHLLYPNAKPSGGKTEWTREYSVLRKYAKLLIADAYEIPKGLATVLAINS